jgi:hypothetical protein
MDLRRRSTRISRTEVKQRSRVTGPNPHAGVSILSKQPPPPPTSRTTTPGVPDGADGAVPKEPPVPSPLLLPTLWHTPPPKPASPTYLNKDAYRGVACGGCDVGHNWGRQQKGQRSGGSTLHRHLQLHRPSDGSRGRHARHSTQRVLVYHVDARTRLLANAHRHAVKKVLRTAVYKPAKAQGG